MILDKAIKKIVSDPFVGIPKKWNLNHVRVYKFYMVNRLTLLAYSVYNNESQLILLSVGPHENFYRDLEKGIA